MKKLVAMGLIMAVTAALAGCGNSTNKDTTAAAAGEATTAAAAQASKGESLVIYTNSGDNGRAEYLTEMADKAGFKINVVPIGGADLANRLIAEKNNSQADVIIGLNAVEYEKLKKEDILMQYKPDWAANVDMSLGDQDGYYYPTVIQPLVLMYNPEYKDVPKDWTDLTDAKYKDKFTLLGLGGGTGKTVYASILCRYADPNGEYGISEEGWNVIKEIYANAHIQAENEDYVGAVIDGSRPMTTMWGSGVLQNETERDFKFAIMSPEIGVPYVVEQVGIVATSKKTEQAQKFANWFGTTEVQAEWSQKFGTIPADTKALEQASQEVQDFVGKVHSQEIDWAFVAENIDQWVEKAELEFVH